MRRGLNTFVHFLTAKPSRSSNALKRNTFKAFHFNTPVLNFEIEVNMTHLAMEQIFFLVAKATRPGNKPSNSRILLHAKRRSTLLETTYQSTLTVFDRWILMKTFNGPMLFQVDNRVGVPVRTESHYVQKCTQLDACWLK